MQVVSQAVRDTIDKDMSLEITSRVIAEWELNSYYGVDVNTSASSEPAFFPGESIALPRRPVRSGLPKLVVGEGRITDMDTYPRFRVPSRDMNYKYYRSARLSQSNGSYSTPVGAILLYDQMVNCNRIYVGFEVSSVRPLDARVLVTRNGGATWENTGTWAVTPEGVLDLHYASDGSWSISPDDESNAYDEIDGVWVRVLSVDGPGKATSIIQVSPRLRMNLSDRTVGTNVTGSREDYTQVSPVGRSASRTARVDLSNHDGFFDVHNQDSPLYGMLDKNVILDISDVVHRSDGIAEPVRQGKFFSESWGYDSEGGASVEATDRSKFLQETMVQNSFYWNQPAENIARDVVEKFGHPLHVARTTTQDANRKIPYVFFKNDQSVWDALQTLATAEQASFYFDEHDNFVWETRDWVWRNRAVDYRLRNKKDGDSLANIIDLNHNFEVGANKVTVRYTPLEPAKSPGGEIINNVVWEQSEDLVLQSSPLQRDIISGRLFFTINAEDWRFMADEGVVNIGGEYIKYRKHPSIQGRLLIEERALYGSEEKDHLRNPLDNFWSFVTTTGFNRNQHHGNTNMGRYRLRDSYVQLHTLYNHARTIAHFIGGDQNDQYALYGCEMYFPATTNSQGEPTYGRRGLGGLFIHSDLYHNGYYFELTLTQEALKYTPRLPEIRVLKRSIDGRFIEFPLDNPGRRMNIVPGRRYRLEVVYNQVEVPGKPPGGRFSFYVDGRFMFEFEDLEGAGTQPNRGHWGVYVRHATWARFENVWAVNRRNQNTDLAMSINTIRDRIDGSFASGTLEHMWKSYNRMRGDVVFEDFGPWVHEGREFDVNYEVYPNNSTEIFVSNDEETFLAYHDRDPFRSQFALFNARRDAAVVTGQDPRKDNQSMALFVYGRPIIEQEESSIDVEDKLAIQRRGLEEVEVESLWIQTKARAQRIADWITERWGTPNDVITVNSIVVPHMQLGDLVEIDMADKHMYPSTHRYNVVAIDKTVGSDHSMALTLRRCRN